MCYIFAKLKGKEGQKDKRKEKKYKNKEKKKQRRKELEIIHDRVPYMDTYLKKDQKGKKEDTKLLLFHMLSETETCRLDMVSMS